MPVVQTSPAVLVDVIGSAEKPASTGSLRITLRIEGDAVNGFPPEAELDAILGELFTAVGGTGWVGSVSKQYSSSTSFVPGA